MILRHASVFSQLLSIVNRNKFARLVKETGAEKGAKGFSCWDQFVARMFCQLAQAKSLREIGSGLRSCEGKLKHLGLAQAPGRTTLSCANAHRSWKLLEGVFHDVLAQTQVYAPKKKLRFKHNANRFITAEQEVPQRSNIRADETIEFNVFQAGRQIRGSYRRVKVWLPDKQQELVLLTNLHHLGATTHLQAALADRTLL